MTTGQKGFPDKPPPNNPSFNVLPPPINRASKPGPRRDTPQAGLVGSSQHPRTHVTDAIGRRLVAVYVDADRLGELEEVLHHLGLPLLLAPSPDPTLEHLDHSKLPPSPRNDEPDDRDSDHYAAREVEDFTASLSGLSITENIRTNPSDLFPARSGLPNKASWSVSPGKKRYYSITIGKCTGVYWDTW